MNEVFLRRVGEGFFSLESCIATVERRVGDITLLYVLCEQEIDERKSYSIIVASEGRDGVETAHLPDITSDKSFASRIFYLFSHGTVFPYTAKETLLEYLG